MLLAYREDPSSFALGRSLGVRRQTVQRCVERAVAYGPLAALDDRPRPGKEPTITASAKAWLADLACRKAKEMGYPHELWTTRLLARHAREHGPAEGHGCLSKLAQGTVCKSSIGKQSRRTRSATTWNAATPSSPEVLYREVAVLKEAAAAQKEPGKPVAVVFYDEKPGIQAIATRAPDLPPKPGVYASFARDYEYKRHGALSLLAWIDLLTGRVHALVKDRHRSREFIECLKLLDAAYPAETNQADPRKIMPLTSRRRPEPGWQGSRKPLRLHLHAQTRLLAQPDRRLLFQASAIRAAAHPRRLKQELKERILPAIDDINHHPVVHTWPYQLNQAA
jgi:hypothetical protein